MIRVTLLGLVLTIAGGANGQEPAWTPRRLEEEEVRLRALVRTPLATRFLDVATGLPDVESRTIWVNRERTRAVSDTAYQALPEAEREGLAKRECDAQFYYCTGYGSPLFYARPLEVLGERGGLKSLEGKKVLDFGYGMIGQLRMMARMGAEVHGVDVNAMLPALYDRPEDVGPVDDGGSLALHAGQWPAEPALVEAIGDGYDLILSKNVLKRGYIHPSRPADPRTQVKLGVDDAAFLRAVHDALRPGGVFLIYNLCPPKSTPDQPYVPWAEGECPFSRADCEAAGFEVVAFDEVDDAEIRAVMAAVEGGDADASKLDGQLFAWYTLLRRKP